MRKKQWTDWDFRMSFGFLIIASMVFTSNLRAADRDTWQRPEDVLDALNLNVSKDIFCEIGAGEGYFSLKAAKRAKHVFAIDVDSKRLATLAKKVDQGGIKNVTPVVAIYSNPLLPPQTCDIIFMAITYHHIENRVEYLKQLVPALKPGGRYVNVDNVYEVSKYKNSTKKLPSRSCRFRREDFLKESADAGFKPLKSHTFLETQYMEELVPR